MPINAISYRRVPEIPCALLIRVSLTLEPLLTSALFTSPSFWLFQNLVQLESYSRWPFLAGFFDKRYALSLRSHFILLLTDVPLHEWNIQLFILFVLLKGLLADSSVGY